MRKWFIYVFDLVLNKLMRKQRFIASSSLVRKERTEIAKTCELGQIEELIQIVKGQKKFVHTERILLCHFIYIYGEQ